MSPVLAFASPGPLVFQLGPFALRWYGLLIALAVLSGLALATRLGKARGIAPGLIADLLPVLVLGAVVGARAYYVALEWRQYAGNWPEALAIWHGGIAIHGALLGGSLATIMLRSGCPGKTLAIKEKQREYRLVKSATGNVVSLPCRILPDFWNHWLPACIGKRGNESNHGPSHSS